MNSIFAIAILSLRSAIRSKIVLVLLFFLLLTLIGLPLSVRGDGTLSGHVHILLRYTLGLATLILSVATVWASCATLSTEIRDRQIQLVVSKPVRPVQIWLGKWLGLAAMNAFFLLLCFGATYAALRWTTQPQKLTAEEVEQLHTEILVAQRKIAPVTPDLTDEVMRQYRAGRARGEWPPDMRTTDILPRIERTVRAHVHSVAPGTRNQWVFRLPHEPPTDRPLILRYRFSASVLDLEPVLATWSAGAPDAPDRDVTSVEVPPRTWQSLAIAPERVTADGTLTIEFANHHERAVTVIFNPEEGLQLMMYAGGFLPNYFRAYTLLLFHLLFLAAIGITAGAYFSIPVAAMASFYALLLLNAGRLVGRIAERKIHVAHHPDAGWLEQAIDAAAFAVYRVLHLILRPLEAANPLDLVALGQWIGWSQVGYMLVVKLLLYSGILLVLGAWHLRHKEVALPS